MSGLILLSAEWGLLLASRRCLAVITGVWIQIHTRWKTHSWTTGHVHTHACEQALMGFLFDYNSREKKKMTWKETGNTWLTVTIPDLHLKAKVTGSCTFCQPILKKKRHKKKFDKGSSRQREAKCKKRRVLFRSALGLPAGSCIN